MDKIKWTEKAISNLQAIHDYISRDSKTYATRFIKSLIHATLKLEKMPRCGRIIPELKEYGFREVIFQNYRIVYRVVESSNDIEILVVIHCARNFETAFSQEWEL